MHSAVRSWSWRSRSKRTAGVNLRSFISRQNDVYMMTLRGAITLNRHHLLLGHLLGDLQVIQQDPARLGQVGVVFRLGFIRLGRQRVFIFFLQLFERVFTLALRRVFSSTSC